MQVLQTIAFVVGVAIMAAGMVMIGWSAWKLNHVDDADAAEVSHDVWDSGFVVLALGFLVAFVVPVLEHLGLGWRQSPPVPPCPGVVACMPA